MSKYTRNQPTSSLMDSIPHHPQNEKRIFHGSEIAPVSTKRKSPSTSHRMVQIVPQAGDVIRCDDGIHYAITDVNCYDKITLQMGR